MRRTLLPWILSFLLAFVLLSGCATSEALRSARESFDRSKAAGAEVKAPYEYHMAESYLNRAEQEAGEGDGDEARDFARKSGNFSGEAIVKSKGGNR